MGKSTITKLLQTVYRIPFHDADQCVRRLYAKGGPAVAPVAAAFGDVLSEDGAIDRAKLGAKLTHLEGAARTEAFERLDAIVHPLVREERARFVRDQTCWLVGVDIPLLFETGAEGVDHTVAVSCGRDEQRRRALKREGMTPAKLDAILGRQLADEDRVARADFVVETDCYDKARARGQAAGVIEELWGASSLDEAAPCRAVSFDLDNTLWPTWPPIAEAKNALPSLIRAHVPGAAAAFGAEDDDILKGLAAFERDRPVLDVEKDVRHDITARRRVVYRQLAEAYGAPVSHGDALAAAYEDARSEATDAHLDGDALACVASLRAMGVETVGALTNGNAHACGRLGAVLDYWLTAGDVGAAKPRAPPFLAACAQSGSVWQSTMTRPCWLNRSARPRRDNLSSTQVALRAVRTRPRRRQPRGRRARRFRVRRARDPGPEIRLREGARRGRGRAAAARGVRRRPLRARRLGRRRAKSDRALAVVLTTSTCGIKHKRSLPRVISDRARAAAAARCGPSRPRPRAIGGNMPG